MDSAGTRRLIGRVVATAAVASLSGCADASGSAAVARPVTSDPAILACERTMGSAPWHGAFRVRGGTAAVDAADDYFSPNCLIVPWATAVRLTVTNRGHLPHTVVIAGTGVDVDVDAGQTVFVDVPATTRPLRMICSFHVEERMVAEIVPVHE